MRDRLVFGDRGTFECGAVAVEPALPKLLHLLLGDVDTEVFDAIVHLSSCFGAHFLADVAVLLR